MISELRWMEEIPHQLVYGLSPYNPIIYNVSLCYLPVTVANWCRISSTVSAIPTGRPVQHTARGVRHDGGATVYPLRCLNKSPTVLESWEFYGIV